MEPEDSFPCLQNSAICPNMTHVNRVYTQPSYLLNIHVNIKPFPVAARSKAYVCGRSSPVVMGSHTTGGHAHLYVVSVVCCQVEVSSTG
jgi:hypothetical protein